MKFTANRKVLLENLKSMIRVVPKDNPVKELTGFLVEANEDDGYLYLTANNLECAIQRKMKPVVETGGNFVMDARLLTDILTYLNGTDVVFEELKPGTVEIKSESCVYTMRVLDSGIYPRPEMPFPDETMKISGLKALYSKTAATVPKSDISKSLEGIHIDITPKKLRAVSCNGTCVAAAEHEYECGGNLSFTFPKSTLSYLAGAIANDDELEVGKSGAYMVFMKEGMLFSARTLASEYVNVDLLLNSINPAYSAKAEFEDLKDQIERICDISDMGTVRSYVKLEFKADRIDLSTANDVGSGSGEVKVIQIDGKEEYSFYYPASQLKDIFKTIDGAMILQVNPKGYLMAFNRNCKYMLTPMAPHAVQRQEEKILELRKKAKGKTKEKTKTEAKAA